MTEPRVCPASWLFFTPAISFSLPPAISFSLPLSLLTIGVCLPPHTCSLTVVTQASPRLTTFFLLLPIFRLFFSFLRWGGFSFLLRHTQSVLAVQGDRAPPYPHPPVQSSLLSLPCPSSSFHPFHFSPSLLTPTFLIHVFSFIVCCSFSLSPSPPPPPSHPSLSSLLLVPSQALSLAPQQYREPWCYEESWSCVNLFLEIVGKGK